MACPDLGNGPRDKRGIDLEHSIVSIVVKGSDVSRENKRYQVCGDLKVQMKQPVIGSALFLCRLNRSDGSVSRIKFRNRFGFLLRHSSR